MPNIFVVSAPSGAGKTSLVKGVCDIFDFIKPAISFTTRKMRDSEIDGQDYYYVSESKFQDMIGNEEFLEYENVYGNLYGSAYSSIEAISSKGMDVILEIDYKGMLTVLNKIPHATSIYIIPPDISSLNDRLKKRGEDSLDTIETRMLSSHNELKYSKYANYSIVNDDFDDALKQLCLLILLKKIPMKNINALMREISIMNYHIV
tara:strand:+ start:200 stop:814 length:615 start_codon:yes stop_codon:yes gene_type:complete